MNHKDLDSTLAGLHSDEPHEQAHACDVLASNVSEFAASLSQSTIAPRICELAQSTDWWEPDCYVAPSALAAAEAWNIDDGCTLAIQAWVHKFHDSQFTDGNYLARTLRAVLQFGSIEKVLDLFRQLLQPKVGYWFEEILNRLDHWHRDDRLQDSFLHNSDPLIRTFAQMNLLRSFDCYEQLIADEAVETPLATAFAQELARISAAGMSTNHGMMDVARELNRLRISTSESEWWHSLVEMTASGNADTQ